MKGLNKVSLIGRIGHDLKFDNNHTRISIAVKGARKNGDQWEDTTTWIPITFFGKKAEALYNYAGKGSTVYVTGRIAENEYEGKKTIQIIGNDFFMLSSKQQEYINESPADDRAPF